MIFAGIIPCLILWTIIAVDAYRNEIDLRTQKPYTLNSNPAVSWVLLMISLIIPVWIVVMFLLIPFGGIMGIGDSGASIFSVLLIPHVAFFAGPAFYLARRTKTLRKRRRKTPEATGEESEGGTKRSLSNRAMVLLFVAALALSMGLNLFILGRYA